MDTVQAAWYLAAMIDGEGCVHFGATRRRCVQITNTDDSILSACECAAEILGLSLSRRHFISDSRQRQPCYTVRFLGGRETYIKILENVPIQSARKLTLLKALVASYTRPQPRPTREWLEDQYVRRERPLSSIAQEWKMESSNLRYWMKKLGAK